MKNLLNLCTIVGIFFGVALADTPPPVSVFKLKAGNTTGFLRSSTGTISTGSIGLSDLPYSFSSPITNTSGVIACQVANGSQSGCLSSVDWAAFNGKQSALSFGNLTGPAFLTVTGGTAAVVGGGVSLSLSAGYYMPTTTDQSTWNAKQSALSFSSPLVNTSGTISIPAATSLVNGYLSSTDWSTFNGKQAALGFTPANSTITISTTAPLSGGGDLSANRTLSIPVATSLANGYLSSADWSTFNGKQASGNYITGLTGDVTASGPGSVAATVASVGGSSAANVNTATTMMLGSQLANLFFASPNGASGAPSYRSIVAADVPTLNQNTTGTASNVTGVVAVANGGTGSNTQNFVDLTTGQNVAGVKTFTSQTVNSTNGASATPSFALTGTVFTGGGTTNTKPLLLVEPSSSTSTGWSNSGTLLGVNSATGFAGNLLDLQVNGVSKFSVSGGAAVTAAGTITAGGLVTGSSGFARNSNNAQLAINSALTYNASIDAITMFGAASGVTNSTGQFNGLVIKPTYAQTSSAAGTDLLINRTQTSVGSGAQNLIDAQVGGTSKFKVDNTGLITAASAIPATSGGTSFNNYTTGDTLYASATNTLSKLAIGTEGQIKRVIGGVPTWDDFVNISRYAYLYDEFRQGTDGDLKWFQDFSGTGAGFQADTANGMGVVKISTGTTTTGKAGLLPNGNGPNWLFAGKTFYEVIVAVPTVSNGTDSYTIRAGFGDGNMSSDPNNGIYFKHTDSVNSGNWVGVTAKSGTSTTVNSSTAPSGAAGTFQRLGWSYDPVGASVTFYINGVSIGTSSTNLPLTSTAVWPAIDIQKSAGTTARTVNIDAIKVLMVFTNAR